MTISPTDWQAAFDAYFTNEAEDGIDGEALDLIFALKDIPGEEVTDEDCLFMASAVIEAWKQRWIRTLRARE